MRSISLLDCTLRDGGYVNSWAFGKEKIRKIIRKLVQAGVETIECGYLSYDAPVDENSARYHSLDQLRDIIPENRSEGQRFAVMINFGEYPADKLGPAVADSPLLRVAFHKKDVDAAFDYFTELEKLGYKYFIQPMGALNYSDSEFVSLIERVNATNAEAFYVVDSFGVMELPDFRRLMAIADHNLVQDKLLGYHSHNNLQQAYSNSKAMIELELQHDLIIDATVFGMGRGAGNLNIELFARYLNSSLRKQYDIELFLEIFDECLKPIFTNSFWGYSLPFYLSSVHNCHPNYANYFSEKNTLTIKSIHELLSMLSDADKISFTKEKADRIYLQYQENFIDDSEALAEITAAVGDRPILVMAPGKTLATHTEEIQQFISRKSPVIIGVNMAAAQYDYDYLFISNEKRYTAEMPENTRRRIVTSNIRNAAADDVRVNYSSYLIKDSKVYDNPTLMLLRLLRAIGRNEVYLAGFDGFSATGKDNYFSESLSLGTNFETKVAKNSQISAELRKMGEYMQLTFLTPTYY